jgi:O-antigen ligase
MTENKIDRNKIVNHQNKVGNSIHGMLDKGVPWAPFVILGLTLAILAAVAVSFDFGISTTNLIGGGVVVTLLTILVFQSPELGAYLLIISVFSSLSDILTDSGYPSINRPLIALIGLSILVNYVLKTGKLSKLPSITRTEWALLVYYLVIIFSSIQLTDKGNAYTAILDISKDILVGISLLILLNTTEKWERGAWTLIITMTVLSGLGIIKMVSGTSRTFFDFAQFSGFGQIDETGNLRYGGPIGEANIWGQVLTATLPFIIFRLIKDTNPFKKVLLGLSAATILLAIIYTGSRGAFVALLAIAPIIVIVNRIKLPAILVGLAVMTALLIFLPSSFVQRFQTLRIFFDQSDEYALSRDESIVGRRNAMLTGLAMFRDNPFLGVGFGNYGNNYWKYASELGLESGALYTDSDTDLPQAHSLYVEILSETGLLGMLSFATLIGFIFAGLLKTRKKYKELAIDSDWVSWIDALTISILSFLITGFFLHGIFFRFIWMFIGLALAAVAISNNTPTPTFIPHRRNHNA